MNMTDNAESNRRRTVKPIIVSFLFLAILAAGVFGYWYYFLRGKVSSEDARIKGIMVDLSPTFSGILTDVHAAEGASVHRGDLLFSLDTAELDSSLSRAEAEITAARAALDAAKAQQLKLEHGPQEEELEIARSAVARTEAQLKLAKAEYERTSNLFKKDIMSGSEFDHANSVLETAKEARREAVEHLQLLEHGTRAEDMNAAKATTARLLAQVDVAEAAAEQVRVKINLARITAPFDGVVVRRWRDPGGMITAGTPVLTLLDPASLHVEANIDEKYLSRVHVGDAVDISIDAYPKLHVQGKVEDILRAANSEFSLIPSEGVSGTFIKVAQRVPLNISFSIPDGLSLGPGMSVEISILTDHPEVN